MRKITSVDQFMSFRQRILKETAMKEAKPCLVICAGTGGQASGSNDVMRIISPEESILAKGIGPSDITLLGGI